MITFIPLALAAIAFTLLLKLAIIDLKTMLLPNKYVAAFFLCGGAFHASTHWHYETYSSAALGMICGGGLLLLVRTIANHAYRKDTLGMGDVKLMGAGGLWLGFEDIFLAITIGAFAGLLHGVAYAIHLRKKIKTPVNFTHLNIPAGPGFIFGILAVSLYKFQSLPQFLGMF